MGAGGASGSYTAVGTDVDEERLAEKWERLQALPALVKVAQQQERAIGVDERLRMYARCQELRISKLFWL